MTASPIRVLVAKPGLDGHDRGAKIVARALRDAGMEVIYTGLRQTPEQIVNVALQEDVDAIGISILSGAHNSILPRICELLRQEEMEDVLLVVGGIIPNEDIPALKSAGVAEVFQPGVSTQEIVDFIRTHVRQKNAPTGCRCREPPRTEFHSRQHPGCCVRLKGSYRALCFRGRAGEIAE